MTEKTFTVFITKYALSKGIWKREAEPTHVASMVKVGKQCYHGEGREWHRTEEAAIARAEQMRAAKLKALEKQFNRLTSLHFDVEGSK